MSHLGKELLNVHTLKKNVSGLVTTITSIGLLGGVLLSWPLWHAESRLSFPMLPALEALALPRLMMTAGLTGLLLATAIFPGKKSVVGALLLWLALMCAQDINRLQPWIWFYLLVLVSVMIIGDRDEQQTTRALRFLLAAVYFWGGFNKLTPYFAEGNFPWFCEAFELTRPLGKLSWAGYGLAVLEMSFAAGILWPPARAAFRWIIPVFHAVIVLFLWKLDWNAVVIPWNLAMAAMAWLVCTEQQQSEPAKARYFSGELLPVLLAWSTPILHLFGYWPYALSWEMYTNTQPEATFYLEGAHMETACPRAARWNELAFDGGSKLLLDDWSARELHVPMFSSERRFREAGAYLCGCVSDPDSAGLYILKVDRWNKSAESMLKIPCRDLIPGKQKNR